MKPLITVIVPVYNGQDYLLNCINSIQEQTYDNLEMIVVNDGSSDGTAEICRELAARYADGSMMEEADRRRSFKCITLQDEGVSVARNRAMEQASGEYVTFVDADDRVAPGMLQHLYERISESCCDVAGCSFFMWKDEAEWSAHAAESAAGEYEIRQYGPEEYIQRELLCGNTRCWSKLYRREILDRVRFEPGLTIGEDMLFLVRLQEYVHSEIESSYPGYGYYQNTAGTMQRKFSGRVMDQIYCWEKARDVIGAQPSVDRHIVISIMLVVGRMAELERKERRAYIREREDCRQKLRRYLNREVYGLLDRGYKAKTLLYLTAPQMYMDLYHRWKKG